MAGVDTLEAYEEELWDLMRRMSNDLTHEEIDYIVAQVSAQLGIMEYAKEALPGFIKTA